MRTRPIAPHQRPAKFHGWTFVPDNDNEGLTGTEAEEAASALIFALGDGGDGRLDPTFDPRLVQRSTCCDVTGRNCLSRTSTARSPALASCWRFVKAFQ